MTAEMVRASIGDFAAAAERMVRAGVDGVEVLVGMGYLHAQFLSPHVNQRTDGYGGSPEGRRRFLEETLRAIREAVGDRPAIGFRIVPEDDDPDGLDLDDSVAQIVAIAAAGLCDFVNVTVGSTSTLAGVPSIVPSMYTPVGACLPPARAVRSALADAGIADVTVMAVGRINQPQDAERALAEGDADMVGAVRAFIADHQFATKALEGRSDEIRACIACNQACIGHRHTGHAVSCIQHPATGREAAYGRLVSVTAPKSVLVVGGGWRPGWRPPPSWCWPADPTPWWWPPGPRRTFPIPTGSWVPTSCRPGTWSMVPRRCRATWWWPTGGATGWVPGWPRCSASTTAATSGWP